MSTTKWKDQNKLSEGSAHGFEWVIKHNGNGFLCGYVKIPNDHYWYGANYNSFDVFVHGGLSYSKLNDGEFWIGFDCAHYDDAQDPSLPIQYVVKPFPGAEMRNIDYVRAECESLCKQLI
jgi:hypothetical protein